MDGHEHPGPPRHEHGPGMGGPGMGPPGMGGGPWRAFFGPGPGPGQFEWAARPPWAGQRRRRGDIRTAVLSVLAEQAAHGYEVMRTLEERSAGRWRPSPGSVYPTLQLLEDEGLVRSQDVEGRKVYELTDAGREEAAARARRTAGNEERAESPLREAMFQLAGATRQVGMSGSDELTTAAAAILDDARKRLYRLLADA